MFHIRYASKEDKSFWFTLDRHMSENEFELKIRDRQGYIISDENKPIGIMRFSLFWDNTPFINLIILKESYHGRGFGSQTMKHWEEEMRKLGYKFVMTSTQSNEQAQHFYRKIGYTDCGCLLLLKDPAEIFFVKYFDK